MVWDGGRKTKTCLCIRGSFFFHAGQYYKAFLGMFSVFAGILKQLKDKAQ